jgi:hypothetical protein
MEILFWSLGWFFSGFFGYFFLVLYEERKMTVGSLLYSLIAGVLGFITIVFVLFSFIEEIDWDEINEKVLFKLKDKGE